MSAYQHLDDLGLLKPVNSPSAFVLVEASAERNLLARLEFHGVAHRSLWRLESLSGLEQHAPYLCQVERGSDFDDWLGEHYDRLALTWLFSRRPFAELWQHLRRFSKFEDQGRFFFLRLGHPDALHTYVASLSHAPEPLARLFAEGGIEELYFHGPHSGLSRRVRPLFEQPGDSAATFDGCLVWHEVTAKGDG
ncbi:DUF4123 domain-containing protein [Pseudomonas protegens]|uniref:DUF4123 domain-containing protein n=1 Tax=Pseudomonas protegens TaxID=380021 RepID=UPI000641E05F|nr:DUF4123 domain-containing protein [Pseudomonas protegens]